MVVIRTEIKELPEYCEACCYFGSRPHPRDGWMDLCELECIYEGKKKL